MKYVYFVSYIKVTPDGHNLQMGMAEVIVRLPITTFVQIEDIKEYLEMKHGRSITILTYQLLQKGMDNG